MPYQITENRQRKVTLIMISVLLSFRSDIVFACVNFADLLFYVLSFLEDDATGWRGLNGGDSRWSTFSGRYSTRDVPYKRSLRDGRYLVPVIEQ